MNKPYIVKGTPIVPSLCAIAMCVLWYVYFYFLSFDPEGFYATYTGWEHGINPVDFSSLTAFGAILRVAQIVIPIVFFVGVLFLAEVDLRWMAIPMVLPVGYQIASFVQDAVVNATNGSAEGYLFEHPFAFCAPFVVAVLFLLTVTGVIPTKIPVIAVCAAAVVVPTVLTFLGKGEFTLDDGYGDVGYYWSDLLTFALYYVGVGALAIRMRKPRPEDFVTLEEMKAAYDEKMAAQNAENGDGSAEAPGIPGEGVPAETATETETGSDEAPAEETAEENAGEPAEAAETPEDTAKDPGDGSAE